MAHQTPLAVWLYQKRDEMNPRFREFNWPAQIFPGIYDFETKIEWNGFTACGRAIDYDRHLALEKSVSEAIERLIAKQLGLASSGLAVGGANDPSRHALFEALERHYLTKHIERSIPFESIKVESADFAKLDERIPGVKITTLKMAVGEPNWGILCKIHLDNGSKTSFGFAYSDNLEDAVRRAFFEALPNFAWHLADKVHEQSALPWHLSKEFTNKVEALIPSSFQPPSLIVPPEMENCPLNLSKVSILASAPIKVSYFKERA